MGASGNKVRATYTPFVADGPLWWRIKMAVSLLLTPLTVILIGRSIRVSKVAPDKERT